MKYDFKTETGQFFLYDPETGKEWLNYLLNDFGYICSVAHRGGSTVFLKVDGTPIEGNVLPLFSDDKEHFVEVTLA